jgi:hypothetical protein
VTIRIENLGAWGDECELSQVHKQAKETAIDTVRRAFHSTAHRGMAIVGEPKVTTVIVEEM